MISLVFSKPFWLTKRTLREQYTMREQYTKGEQYKKENYREDSSLIFLFRPVAAWSSSMVMCILYFQ